MQLEERFWSKVDKSGDCWIWTAQTHHRDGYGHFNVKGYPVRAHRFSYELVKGPIPDGMGVCHTCDNPPCVNPDHLFAGDQGVNIRDCARKGRLGGNAGKAGRLTDNEILAIRSDKRIQKEIAKDYSVSQHTISMIKLKRIYKHV